LGFWGPQNPKTPVRKINYLMVEEEQKQPFSVHTTMQLLEVLFFFNFQVSIPAFVEKVVEGKEVVFY